MPKTGELMSHPAGFDNISVTVGHPVPLTYYTKGCLNHLFRSPTEPTVAGSNSATINADI